MNNNIVWLQYCHQCKYKHYVKQQLCVSCLVYDVPQPIFERVYNNCCADYRCDGCHSYEDHIRVY